MPLAWDKAVTLLSSNCLCLGPQLGISAIKVAQPLHTAWPRPSVSTSSSLSLAALGVAYVLHLSSRPSVVGEVGTPRLAKTRWFYTFVTKQNMCPTCLAHPFPGFPHCLHLSPHPSIVEEVGTSRLAKKMVLRLCHKTNLCQIGGRDPILPHLVPFPRLFHTSGTHLAITSPP